MSSSLARLIALYLPQFHPIPENDEWWGKGFTEWTNTAKAKPLYPGHYQPHVPADLGFYDLRCPESRVAQADLARQYGIEAFCYYHYWFAGQRIIERPFNEVLASGQPDFPFCLCWANQTWSGIWHGNPRKVLIEQTYPGLDDHRRHFEYLLTAFRDPRYVRVDGKPLLAIYQPLDIPDVARVMAFWRDLAVQAGLPGLHLVGMRSHQTDWTPEADGFDALCTEGLPAPRPWVSMRTPLKWARRKLAERQGRPTVYKYGEVMANVVPPQRPGVVSYPTVIPNWDNTPRSGARGIVLHGSTPELFRAHVRQALDARRDVPPERNLVFIKSWNEWAEGNHLEPDLRFGRQYLEVLRDECAARGTGTPSAPRG